MCTEEEKDKPQKKWTKKSKPHWFTFCVKKVSKALLHSFKKLALKQKTRRESKKKMAKPHLPLNIWKFSDKPQKGVIVKGVRVFSLFCFVLTFLPLSKANDLHLLFFSSLQLLWQNSSGTTFNNTQKKKAMEPHFRKRKKKVVDVRKLFSKKVTSFGFFS